jgi:hypothetical protein|tara:strand:- start:1011 stop:1511 length:501 start_codon:yes stop_codon:yes gene_type:complete
MAAVTRNSLKGALSEVVNYDGGNNLGKNMDLLVDNIRDKEVIDGSGGDVTLTADQSGGYVFVSGGARTVTLPTVAAGLNFRIITTDTGYAHVISSSAGTSLLNGWFLDHTNLEVNGNTAITKLDSKQGMTLTNSSASLQIWIETDGTEWYMTAPGSLNDTPTFTPA